MTAAVVAVSLTACQDPKASSAPVGASASPSSTPATVTVAPADGATGVSPDAPVTVTVAGGRLSSVTLTPESGEPLTGALAADGGSWTASGLKPGETYTVAAVAKGRSGADVTSSASFVTQKAKSTVRAEVTPHKGWNVGVGMPVVVDFTKTVKDKAAAEKAVTVTSVPAVEGGFHWMSAKQLQWRPKAYWPAHTAVTVATNLSGVQVAPGVWGATDSTTAFTVGTANIYTVDVVKHTLTVHEDGKVIKTIPVTTGKKGFETRNGTKVIMTRESERRMDAATTGIDAKDPEYYNISVKYAMRLTWSGEFLHAAPWSVASQGHANVSHGCTGMSLANAKWLFEQSKVGDVVEYSGSHRKLEWGNGYTAWNMPFPEWDTTT